MDAGSISLSTKLPALVTEYLDQLLHPQLLKRVCDDRQRQMERPGARIGREVRRDVGVLEGQVLQDLGIDTAVVQAGRRLGDGDAVDLYHAQPAVILLHLRRALDQGSLHVASRRGRKYPFGLVHVAPIPYSGSIIP
jgi:hypothetical protein